MKRIDILLLTALFLFVSCSKEKNFRTLEEMGRENVFELTKSTISKDGIVADVSNLNVKISNDSLCVIQYDYGEVKLEYYILKRDSLLFDKIVHVDDSPYNLAIRLSFKPDYYKNNSREYASEDDKLIDFIYYITAVDFVKNGARRIK